MHCQMEFAMLVMILHCHLCILLTLKVAVVVKWYGRCRHANLLQLAPEPNVVSDSIPIAVSGNTRLMVQVTAVCM